MSITRRRKRQSWELEVVVVPDLDAFFAALGHMLGDGLPRVSAMARRGAVHLATVIAGPSDDGEERCDVDVEALGAALMEESAAELAELAVAADPLLGSGAVSGGAFDRFVALVHHAAMVSARGTCPTWRGLVAGADDLPALGEPPFGVTDASGEGFVRARPVYGSRALPRRQGTWANLVSLAEWFGDGVSTGALLSIGRAPGAE